MRSSSGGCVMKKRLSLHAPARDAERRILSGSGPAWRCFRRSSAPIMCSRPASLAPPESARNSRCREKCLTMIIASRPNTISATMVVTQNAGP